MRAEGENWNAYFTSTETMEGAIYLGSIRMMLATHPQIRDAFLDIMRQAMTIVLKDISGQDVVWEGEIPAPEHERSGSA